MVERLLPADDPVLENVLKWTVERDAKDVRRLLGGYPKLAPVGRERRCCSVFVDCLQNSKQPLMNSTACTEG